MGITIAQIVETAGYGRNVVIRAQSGDEKIEIELSPQDVLSLISSLIVARAGSLNQAGEPEPAYPVPVQRFVIGKDQRGEEFLRLYVSQSVYHDYQIPPIGQPTKAFANWKDRVSGKGQARS